MAIQTNYQELSVDELWQAWLNTKDDGVKATIQKEFHNRDYGCLGCDCESCGKAFLPSIGVAESCH